MRFLRRFGVLPNPESRAPTQDWEDAVNAIGEAELPFCLYVLPAQHIEDDTKWRYARLPQPVPVEELPPLSSSPLRGLGKTREAMEEYIVGHLRLLALKSLPADYADGGTGELDANGSADNPTPQGKSRMSRCLVR